eukprot:UN06114
MIINSNQFTRIQINDNQFIQYGRVIWSRDASNGRGSLSLSPDFCSFVVFCFFLISLF